MADQKSLVNEATQLRKGGNLPGAVAHLHAGLDYTSPDATQILLRFLHELQDHATTQVVTRDAVAALARHGAEPANSEYLVSLLYTAERCLPFESVRTAVKSMLHAARSSKELHVAVAAVQHRQKFRALMTERFSGSATIVSLGLNCLPWHLPGRWGLRRPDDFVKAFVPFALAGHSIDGVIGAIESDFATYTDPNEVRIVRTARGHDMAIRNDRGAYWNHNRSKHWLDDEMAALRALNTRKAENFRALCKRPDVVFLMSTCPVEYPREKLTFLPRLNKALRSLTGRPDNLIIVSNQTARNEAAAIHRVNESTSFFYCAYPARDYIWHDDEQADSKAGLTFERAYTTTLVKILAEWKLLTRRKPGTGQSDDIADAA